MVEYTLRDILRKTVTDAGARPDSIALTFDGQHMTFGELDDRSTRLAHGLLAAGFTKGDKVSVVMYNRLEWVELFFALAKLGGVIVPINYLLAGSEMQYIFDDSESRWIVVEDTLTPALTPVLDDNAERKIVEVGEPTGLGIAYESLVANPLDDAPALPDVHADDLFLLQYTSGTTGFPKGAMHTHSTVLWNSYHQIVDFEVTNDDVYYVVPALCWAAGFHDLALAALWRGGRVVLGRSTGFDPGEFLQQVEQHGATKVLLVPTVLKRVLNHPEFDRYDTSSLRMVLSGGEPVPPSSLEGLKAKIPHCDVLQVYGMSEFPTLMLLITGRDAHGRAGSTGKACSVATIRIIDDAGQDVPAGTIGQIICRSPANMIGYYNKPEATASALADGWLHTGDLASYDDEGFVYMAGRAKDMIITGGLNVYPAEIERVLATHPDVIEAAVVGEPDERWGEIGIAHVVVRDDAHPAQEDVEAYLRERMAGFKVPRVYRFTTQPLPRTTSGKVQKHRLDKVTHDA
ncbi:class I adenylate-forming enzyme family protein [Pseudonocardia acidicola]|uniref:Long-chain fatty acid--CoA ligase n=1 Tax=Pseudonocardia acidicola TaxID=2724939 RepID=A0ABX1S740_9PSEU|nr:AMP-binding protein [Pseudonocardia acidicola]NMH96622.1 long-chain fatty acid--CoA ligase [Pseudonocardia acidicola]